MCCLRIVIVHEVNYLSKIIYEFQILPEMLSILGHDVTVIDYDDSWHTSTNGRMFDLGTRTHNRVHRAYPQASITVRRPGMVRLPMVSRISAAVTTGLVVHQVLNEGHVDAVLLYGLPTVGIQTLLLARLHRVPIFFRSIDVLHRLVPHPALAAPTRILERIVYNRVDGIVTVTPHLKNYIKSFGVPDSRVDVLPSGVDADMFSPGDKNAALLETWDIRPTDKVVLFMGTIYRFSGLDSVIRGLPEVLARHPNTKLFIAGVGEDEPRLKKLAADLGLQPHIIFAGLQPYAMLPALIRSSDVCINPFELNEITRDILPTKLFQYLACGKPVLATRLPGTEPFLAGEEHGMVYSDLEHFSLCLSDLLSNPEKCAGLGRRGQEVSRQNYDWKSIATKLVSWMQARSN